MSKPLKVMIIGAGTGGLCLAHGLPRNGIAVEVFERDGSPADHQPGYRLSISSTGSAALRSCLPDAQYRKFVAKSGDPGRAVTFSTMSSTSCSASTLRTPIARPTTRSGR